MDTRYLTKQLLILIALSFWVLIPSTAQAQPVKGSFLYYLSSFTGAIPYNLSRVVVDKSRNEVYVLFQNTLRVFNEFGMETYRFGDDLDLGHIVDVAVDKNGDILLLTYKQSEGEPVAEIIQCNYRGEPKSKIELNICCPIFKFPSQPDGFS